MFYIKSPQVVDNEDSLNFLKRKKYFADNHFHFHLSMMKFNLNETTFVVKSLMLFYKRVTMVNYASSRAIYDWSIVPVLLNLAIASTMSIYYERKGTLQIEA